MSINKHRPHVFILPEDDANRQLANGFVLGVVNDTQVRILSEVGGWVHVCDKFAEEHVEEMRRYPSRFMILLIDFDSDPQRLQRAQQKIPDDLEARVFVVGVRPEPEALRRDGCGSYEAIGRKLAQDCGDESKTETLWDHEYLKHNDVELVRLRHAVRGLLFQALV
jgi:hypothetical protein